MIKVEEEQKIHSYILWNTNPKAWEQRYTPISRDKARELEKARKEGKMPSQFYVIELGMSDNVQENGYCDSWPKKEFDEIRKRQKFMSSFLDEGIPIFMSLARYTA